MFIPATTDEVRRLGWSRLDVVLVTGDAYVDSPFSGIALIGKVLLDAGYRVAIIAQPDIFSERDIRRFGEPTLFWGITAGNVDSMVANYTASLKKRNRDDYTPGGINNKRPDRAVIVYANLIRRYYKRTKPIVIGGIEASLRRIAHYDFWTNKIRKSILFDAKADILIYGMGEKTIVELALRLKNNQPYQGVKGLCYIAPNPPSGYLELPDFDSVRHDKAAFTSMFLQFYHNCDPKTAKGLYQKTSGRYCIQNPPNAYLSQDELDAVYEMLFERDLHPSHSSQGTVRALDTIRFSLTTHRGCYGECNFCAIAVHQGRTVRWRSIGSVLKEVEQISRHPGFHGKILDAGGPTANMYGFECAKKQRKGVCRDKRCLYPQPCPNLKPDHSHQLKLLSAIRKQKGIQKVFVTSGLRPDLIQADLKWGDTYLKELVKHHVSGQLKIAPEHSEKHVLRLMGKPGIKAIVSFKDRFFQHTRQIRKKQYLTYYFIAAHPGCSAEDMTQLHRFAANHLKINPRQVQIFTPTPSTFSTLMYYTGQNPFTGKKMFVEKNRRRKDGQKAILTRSLPQKTK